MNSLVHPAILPLIPILLIGILLVLILISISLLSIAGSTFKFFSQNRKKDDKDDNNADK